MLASLGGDETNVGIAGDGVVPVDVDVFVRLAVAVRITEGEPVTAPVGVLADVPPLSVAGPFRVRG